MIKCIVCDLDGTLIKTDDTIEEKTLVTLKNYLSLRLVGIIIWL